VEVIDYEQHWSESQETYYSHPTSRHRRRFVLRALRRVPGIRDAFIFDYGCGPGFLLKEIQQTYKLSGANLGGSDLSVVGVEAARAAIPEGTFLVGEYPTLSRPIDIAISTEVIEHTSEYRKILAWMVANARPGGTIIITTPGGTMDLPDVYYGHIQHFTVPQLSGILRELGCEIIIARNWGWPGFTLQKWVTRKNFDHIRDAYMGGALNTRKRVLFRLVYWAYLLHDFINAGPQIFLMARKQG
jgi:SAM-dependent methyltransferase